LPNQMHYITENEQIDAFNFNFNGRIDTNDIVKRFGKV
jgi:hypothetical protein